MDSTLIQAINNALMFWLFGYLVVSYVSMFIILVAVLLDTSPDEDDYKLFLSFFFAPIVFAVLINVSPIPMWMILRFSIEAIMRKLDL